MLHYKTLSELHRGNGWPAPGHPLFSMLGCQSECPLGDREFTSDCYMIGFKKLKSGIIRYGRTGYDHNNGSMLFIKPRQIFQMKEVELEEQGFMILIHEDYLNGHELHEAIEHYGFFEYEVHEALHLSPAEEHVIRELHDKIAHEYHGNPDEFSRDIILSHVTSVLKYAQRYYNRQFINRKTISGKTVTSFNGVLKLYLKDEELKDHGLPSVKELAEKLHISPRYLSDLLKQETGKTAMELIHISIIGEAKNLLFQSDEGIAEIAYHLGFENISYFSRLFKKQTGFTPLEFRKEHLNQKIY